MTADVELLPLPERYENFQTFADWKAILQNYARANVEHHTAAKDAEIEALREKTAVTMGVGTGDGSLFVHGDHESIKAAQAIVLQRDALRSEVERLEEALRGALDAVRDTLQSSYNSAGQECCGRSGFECCGAPVLIWAPEDQAVMDKLAPIERLLSSALNPTAAQENDDA